MGNPPFGRQSSTAKGFISRSAVFADVIALIYRYGIIGIPGKGPHYMENYDSNRTIGQIIQTSTWKSK